MKDFKRNLNLLRKTLSSAAIRLLLQPLKLLKIKPNRALFSSYMEKQYSCSPKYISMELMRLYPGKVEIGWAFRQPEKYKYLEREGIKVFGTKTLRFIVFALTSRVVCTNTYYKPTLPRRKKQFYLNTWHGGGAYKKVGRYVDMPWIERLNTFMREGRIDLYLSSGRFFTEHVLRDSFGYKGEVAEWGMPRNDMMVNGVSPEEKERIRRVIGLKDGEKLCLYAPTYRRDTKVHDFGLDYAKALESLSRIFGGSWVMGCRSHHVSMYKDQSKLVKGALDLSLYPDMQELLCAADAVITDYSSCIWDAALAKKPVFLYAPDLDEYLKERAFYTDIRSWPFALALNNEELAKNVENFDKKEYNEKIRAHLDALGSCESGKAAFLAAERIAKEMGVKQDK